MKNEAQAHLQKARSRLEEAKTLLDQAQYSGVANRAYYAMFEAASAMLAQLGLAFETHEAVKSKFGEHFAKVGKVNRKFGRDLSRAYDLRLDADYAIDARSEVSSELGNKQFQMATEFLAMAEEYLGRSE